MVLLRPCYVSGVDEEAEHESSGGLYSDTAASAVFALDRFTGIDSFAASAAEIKTLGACKYNGQSVA